MHAAKYWLSLSLVFLCASSASSAGQHGPQSVRGLQPGAVQPLPAIPAPAAASSAAQPSSTVPVPSQGASSALEMALVRPRVEINQPVLFRVRSDREVYFSVLSVAQDGSAQQLVPRPDSKPVALAAGTTHELPHDYELRVPTPGSERLYLVAATRPLPVIGADGRVLVAPTGTSADAALVVREVQLEVVDPAAPTAVAAPPTPVAGTAGAPASELPRLVFDAPRRVYRIGETVELQYGASRDGWLHLFLQVGHTLEPLGAKQVQADRFQVLHATATKPAGEQVLVALWSAGQQLDDTARATLERKLRTASREGGTTRALTLVVEVPIAYRTIALLINP